MVALTFIFVLLFDSCLGLNNEVAVFSDKYESKVLKWTNRQTVARWNYLTNITEENLEASREVALDYAKDM